MTFPNGPLTIEVDGDIFLNPIAPTFGSVDRAFIVKTFRDRSRWLAGRLSHAIRELQKGSIGRRTFVRQTLGALQRAYLVVYSLGALSVDQFHITRQDDIEAIQSELSGERRFLQSFARDLSRGTLELAPEFRARLYFAALRGVFEMGRLAALPAGPYDWVLGDTDHCDPCIIASINGPYKKNALARLNLPVLPGIPGSGEVCRGLTRCGCTVRLPNYPVNESLQLQLRDILNDINIGVSSD